MSDYLPDARPHAASQRRIDDLGAASAFRGRVTTDNPRSVKRCSPMTDHPFNTAPAAASQHESNDQATASAFLCHLAAHRTAFLQAVLSHD